MDPQRLVQRAVERGAVAPELSPELLLSLGVGERGGIASGPLYLGGVAGAGGRGLGAVSSVPRHHVTLAPPHEGPLLGLGGACGEARPLVPPGRRGVVVRTSTTSAREPPAGAGPSTASTRASTAAGARPPSAVATSSGCASATTGATAGCTCSASAAVGATGCASAAAATIGCTSAATAAVGCASATTGAGRSSATAGYAMAG
jgi:hypothetical protein